MKVTKEQAEEMLLAALENGWEPEEVRELSCSCHINPPCSKHCLDGDYLDEFIEEKELEII